MSDVVKQALKQVALGTPLSSDEAENYMDLLMRGHVSPIQTAGMLAAMAVRGETVEEIVGFARGMRANSLHLANAPANIVDTCGTGGDGKNTFNISTAAGIVAAAAGVPIAKHGNRAASSKSGSADVLQALGASLDIGIEGAEECLSRTNFCFMFAQQFHPAMKHAAEARKQLGFRTIFNILGPLTNPAGAKRQLLGVFKPGLVRPMAEALLALGSEHVLVVHGGDGLDEISLSGETMVAELKDGSITEYVIRPSDFGLSEAPIESVVGDTAEVNARMIHQVLQGDAGPRRDIVVLNASAVLYVGGVCQSINDGIRLAQEVIDSGRALETLTRFVEVSREYAPAEVLP